MVNDMAITKVPYNELVNFLILAKQNSYAGDGTRVPSKCLLSKNYLFELDGFRYEDQYFGEYVDVGEEIVWYQSVPIWGMGYRGGMKSEFDSEREETFKLLRQALMAPDPTFPVRGPSTLNSYQYYYTNFPQGDLLSFTGREIIRNKYEEEIYFRNYVGGIILGKNNPDMIVE